MCVCVTCIAHCEKAVAGGRNLIAAIIRAFVRVGGVSGVTVSANRAPGDKLYTYIMCMYSGIIVVGTSELTEHISSHSVHFSTTSLLDSFHTPLHLNATTLLQRRLYVINSQTSSRPPRSTTSRKARLLSLEVTDHGEETLRRREIEKEREIE